MSEPEAPPTQHVKRTFEVLPASSVVPEAELVALRDRTLARLREKPIANIGRLGKFFFQGGRVQFSPSPTLWQAALEGSPLPGASHRSRKAGREHFLPGLPRAHEVGGLRGPTSRRRYE